MKGAAATVGVAAALVAGYLSFAIACVSATPRLPTGSRFILECRYTDPDASFRACLYSVAGTPADVYSTTPVSEWAGPSVVGIYTRDRAAFPFVRRHAFQFYNASNPRDVRELREDFGVVLPEAVTGRVFVHFRDDVHLWNWYACERAPAP